MGPVLRPPVATGPASRGEEERALRQRSTGERLYQLDALRGIAAATVVFHHMRNVIRPHPPGWFATPFFAGPEAVDLFFVLSGFVLSLPYWHGHGTPYPVYLLRRIIRIYLPFAAAAALSIVGAAVFWHHNPPLTEWFTRTWHTRPTRSLVADQFLMAHIYIFNTAFWSLRYEMQLSFVMPLIAWLMKRTGAVVLLIICFVAGFANPVAVLAWHSEHNVGSTIQIGSLFVLGAALSFHQQRLRAALRRLGSGAWLVLAVSLFFFFAYPDQFPLGRFQTPVAQRDVLMSGLGAAGILMCALEMDQLKKLLRHGIVEYLGRISYSLYLTHSIVLFAAFDLLFGKLPKSIIYAFVLLGAVAFAHVFCVAVEEPCIGLGKRVKTAAGPTRSVNQNEPERIKS